MQKFIDISVPVSKDIPVWEGDPAVKISSAASIGNGDIANVSFLNMGAHTGTHVDAPVHFVQGRTGVDQMPLETLIGEAFVVDLSGVVAEVHAEDFEKAGIPEGTVRLLCKTSNSTLWSRFPDSFYRDFVGIAPSGAGWLVEHNIRLVGVDYLGVERYDSVSAGAPTHHKLLEAEVIIIEGLDLSEVDEGKYGLVCLPVKFKDLDGAPCRAILIKEE